MTDYLIGLIDIVLDHNYSIIVNCEITETIMLSVQK